MTNIAHPTQLRSIPQAPARQRLDWLLAELKGLLVEVNQDVGDVEVILDIDDRSSLMPLLITPRWSTGFYDGDGIYSGGSKWTRHCRYRVSRMHGWLIDGEPAYSVIELGETDRSKWMELSESRLKCFIGEKLSITKKRKARS